MLFDTTFFIDLSDELRAGKPGPCQAFLRTHRHQVRKVSVVTLGEYAVGATAAEVRRFFRGFQPLALGRETAVFAGRLQASLKFTLGENDLWIAATALRERLPLVSRDTVFPLVPKLRVLSY